MGGFAWVTLATNDSYSLGALVLAHSLKQAGTTQQLAVLITPGVTNAMREKLQTVFNVVQEVNILDSRDEANLRLLKRPELGVTFTKLHCWRLTQYEKCVFLDADTLVLQNCDELFEREELSAAPDVGWPDCFNSGVFVYRPSNDTFDKLIQFALEKGSFDGGDQGLLNLYFSDWAHKDISKHLPFIYNMCSTACYSYLPAFKQYGSNAKIIHFIGATKPWLQYFNTETRKVQPSGDSVHLQEVLQRWWDIFCSLIHPQLSPSMPEGRSQQYYSNPSHSFSHNNSTLSYQTTQQSSSASDFQNDYDPWEDYHRKQSEIQNNTHLTIHESPSLHNISHAQPNESPNTSASFVAEHHSSHSHPQTHDTNHNQPQTHHTTEHYQHQTHHTTEHYQHQSHHETYYNEPHQQTINSTHNDNYVQHHHNTHQQQNKNTNHQFSEPQTHQHQDMHHTSQYNFQLIESHNIPQEESIIHNVQHTETHFHDPPPSNQHHNDHHNTSFSNETHHRSPCPSPKRVPSPIPEVPNECKATDIVSNDVSLAQSTEEIEENAGLAGAFAKLTLGVARTPEQETFESVLRKQAWEVGNIDYLGKDSFENIWNKISETLAAVPVESQPEAETETSKETPKEMPEVALKTETKVPLETPKCDVVAQETSNVEIPAEPAVTETIVSPPIQTSQPLKQDEHPTAEASIVTEVSAASLPSPISEISSPLETKEIIAKEIKTAEILEQEPVSKACPVPIKKLEPESSQPLTDTQSVLEACPLHAKPSETDLPESPQSLPQIPKTDEQCVLGVQSTPKSEKPLSTMIAEQQPEVSSIVQSLPEAPKDLAGETQSSDIKTSAEGRSESQSTPDECKKSESAAAEGTVVEAVQSEKLLTEAKVVLKTEQILECRKPEKETEEPKPSSLPVSQLSLDSQTIQTATESTTAEPIPQPKVTEPTPPRTPSTPPVAPLPQLENVKQALVIESNVPDTPPPSSSQDVSPTPPPRKEGKSKKSGAKPKK